jgi:hypothetical protein
MSREFELNPADYHLRLMIDRMERDGRSEAAIARAVRLASGRTGTTTITGNQRTGARSWLRRTVVEALS